MTSDGYNLMFFRLISLLVSGFVLLVIFSIYTGLVGLSQIVPTTLTLAAAIALRYVAIYHRFEEPKYRKFILLPITITFIVSGVAATNSFIAAVTLNRLRGIFRDEYFQTGLDTFLPDWWIVGILVPATVLLLLGSYSSRDTTPFKRPSGIREIGTSPVVFGFVCSFFGLWAVLLVGIGIQRIFVVAPLFEELLKFGLALLIGSTLFGRSLAARIGVAMVVGSLFGIVEHASTYQSETDVFYLFRTVFHMATTMLSVSVYTSFESRDDERLQWIAPAYPIVFHFFYNTFVVLSGVITVVIYGNQLTSLSLIYGGAIIFVVSIFISLTLLRYDVITVLHEPIEHVLSDLA